MTLFLLQLAAVSYLVATIGYAGHLLRSTLATANLGIRALAVGFALHSTAIVARFWGMGTVPVMTFGDGLSFFAWLIVGVYLVVRSADKLTVIGAVVGPLACALTTGAAFLYQDASVTVPPMLRSPWLPVHVTLAFLGNAVLGLAFAISVVYLVQERLLKTRRSGWMIQRLPSLEQLDRLNFRCLAWGFPLLTLGILSGGVWAEYASGRFWSWETREVLSLVTWLVYAGLLQFRFTAGLRGRRAATLTIVGFALVVVSFLSVNLLPLPGRHGGNLGS